MSDEPNKIVENGAIRDKDGKFVAGHPALEGAGRPSFSLIALMKDELQKIPEIKGMLNNKTNAELLIQRIVVSAIKEGNRHQIKNLLQYVEGMPKQSIDMSTLGEKITTIQVNIVDSNNERTTDTSNKRTETKSSEQKENNS